MNPDDIKAFKLSMELYQKALEDAITFSNLIMEKFNKLFEDDRES